MDARHSSPSPSSARLESDVHEPHLWRFGLRHMLGFVALTACFCVLMAHSNGTWRLVLSTLAAIIAAHLLGAFLGTRLRDSSAQVRRWRTAVHGQPDLPAIGEATSERPQSPVAKPGLLAKAPTRSNGAYWALGVGMLAGALLGAAAIVWGLGDDVTWPGVVIGSLSCGTVGAWVAMILSSFWTVGRRALAESIRDSE